MNKHKIGYPSRGFSLIEVLIAVVILSFGLLALAALQTRLFQASADAKAQSVAIGLAKDQLETMRSFSSLQGYRDLTSSGPTTISDGGALGGVNFTRTVVVDRYALPVGGAAFDNSVPLTGALSSSAYVANNEFKTIAVQLTWADESGRTHGVRIEDAVAGLDPMDTSRNQRKIGTQPRGPKVIIYDPSNQDGVIPIALGDGSETAATNPKPVNVSRAGEDAVETRFDVLTYSALTGDGNTGRALAQARVETSVVGCVCSKTATTAPVYRPTYWNGERYVAPRLATYTAQARATSGVAQSRYCDKCCATHHDPGATTGTANPTFSPRNLPHNHYKVSASNVLTGELAGNGDRYLESCRLIRVDGIFDVAADLSNDYFNLLETGAGGDDYVPSVAGIANYQNFALNYLEARYVAQSSGFNSTSSPNPQTYAAGLYSKPNTTQIDIRTGAEKWLHARGLYIDYLEQSARDAVADAKSSCKGVGTSPTQEELRDCVLRVLPFTSINLTELAVWSPITGTTIKVTNDEFSTSEAFTKPIRGKVTTGTNPQPPNTANAYARIRKGNSGVAVFLPISAGDAVDEQHNQTYKIPDASGGVGDPGGTFTLDVLNYAFATNDPPQVGYTYGSRNDTCSATSGNSNPFGCSTRNGEPLGPVMTIRVGNYNKLGLDQRVATTCQKNNPMPYQVVYDVVSVAASSGTPAFGTLLVSKDGRVGTIPDGEYTEFTATGLAGGNNVDVTLSGPTYMCPENYPGSGKSFNCSGPPNQSATWSTIYVPCPNQAAPPDFSPAG